MLLIELPEMLRNDMFFQNSEESHSEVMEVLSIIIQSVFFGTIDGSLFNQADEQL